MTLSPGTRLGAYEVTAQIGVGSGGVIDISVVLNWLEELKRLVPTG